MIILISGLMIIWGSLEAAYLYVLLTGGGLAGYENLLLPALAVGVLLAAVLCFLYSRLPGRRDDSAQKALPLSFRRGGVYLLILAVAGGLTLVHFAGSYVVDLSDAVYEMAVNTASSGLLAQQHPFTGELAGSIPMRLKLLGLYALYAAVMDLTGLSAYTLMGQIVPVFVWLLHMGIMTALGRTLLRGRERYLWLFVSLTALIDLATAHIEGMIGYRLFYEGFSGETMRAAVLLPCCVLCCCRRRWLPALLCAAAEATLVWTTYGLGYCIFVIAVFFAVTLWQDRRERT